MNQVQSPIVTREAANQTPGANGSGITMSREFYCEPAFCKIAGTLRAQFENQILGARDASGGLTPFTYAFCENAYQFLTASAERVFSAEVLEELIASIRSWAATTLDMTRVSTPQVRLFVQGCQRNLLRDDIASPWRYSLSLTPQGGRQRIGSMLVVTEEFPERAPEQPRIDRALRSTLEFNQWLVHKTRDAYSIEITGKAKNPLEGVVFLDGYLW